jgi:DNA-binding NarL/FixJ family response regulator
MVLDLRMPGQSGIDVLRAVQAEKLRCRVVLLTAALRDAEAAEIAKLGAKGLVLKESAPEVLVSCVRKVHQGEQWFDRATMARAFDRVVRSGAAAPSGAALTPRELEIVRMIAQGLRNREIGQRLFISEGTVKIHLHNTYEKLGVDGRLELLLYAQEKGLI